jgi:hypothetical protein
MSAGMVRADATRPWVVYAGVCVQCNVDTLDDSGLAFSDQLFAT